MRTLKILAVLLLLGVPALAYAELGQIPTSATWYFHADFDALRNGKASRGVYDWLDTEVFEEIRDETGIDFDKEVQQMTAFSAADAGPVILVDGKFSQETRDKVVAIAAADGELQTFKSSGKTYYLFDGEGDDNDVGNIDIDIESLEKEAYVSVALKNKILVTNSKDQMERLLANNGKIDARKKENNALFVLRAERSLIQAGVNTDEMDKDDDWDSNILRNTRQVAVLMADLGDKLGVKAQLVANEADMANSLASVVRGLISLQAFNDDIEPGVAAVLQSTKVDVAGSTLNISLELDPDTVVSALEN